MKGHQDYRREQTGTKAWRQKQATWNVQMTDQDGRQFGVYVDDGLKEFGFYPMCKKSHPVKASKLGRTMAAARAG